MAIMTKYDFDARAPEMKTLTFDVNSTSSTETYNA